MNINKSINCWANNFFKVQIITLLSLSLILIIFSAQIAVSFFLGGSCCLAPGRIMSYFSFKKIGALYRNDIVKYFFFGECIKMLATAAFILIIIVLFDINIYAFFIGYLVSVAGYIWIPLLTDKDR